MRIDVFMIKPVSVHTVRNEAAIGKLIESGKIQVGNLIRIKAADEKGKKYCLPRGCSRCLDIISGARAKAVEMMPRTLQQRFIELMKKSEFESLSQREVGKIVKFVERTAKSTLNLLGR